MEIFVKEKGGIDMEKAGALLIAEIKQIELFGFDTTTTNQTKQLIYEEIISKILEVIVISFYSCP